MKENNSEKNIEQLIKSNRNRIDLLRELLNTKLTTKHDDLFLLKYCLSYTDNKTAEKKIRKGLSYRKENIWLRLAEFKGEERMPNKEVIEKYVANKIYNCKIDEGPAMVIEVGGGETKKLMVSF